MIETLPPLPVLTNELATSLRTGEPRRPVLAVAVLVAFLLAAASVALVYAIHWTQAVTPASYALSAHVIEWVTPEPGKWLALAIEGAIAAFAALVAGSCGVAGFQAWNGWRWSRWAGLVAVALTVGMFVLINDYAWIAILTAGLGAIMAFLPPMTRFFREFATFRSAGSTPYRRPERIFYGRLPRFR